MVNDLLSFGLTLVTRKKENSTKMLVTKHTFISQNCTRKRQLVNTCFIEKITGSVWCNKSFGWFTSERSTVAKTVKTTLRIGNIQIICAIFTAVAVMALDIVFTGALPCCQMASSMQRSSTWTLTSWNAFIQSIKHWFTHVSCIQNFAVSSRLNSSLRYWPWMDFCQYIATKSTSK